MTIEKALETAAYWKKKLYEAEQSRVAPKMLGAGIRELVFLAEEYLKIKNPLLTNDVSVCGLPGHRIAVEKARCLDCPNQEYGSPPITASEIVRRNESDYKDTGYNAPPSAPPRSDDEA